MSNEKGRIVRANPAASIQRMNSVNHTEPPKTQSVGDNIGKISSMPLNDERSLTGGVYNPVLITETCFLPSKGKLYGGAVGESIEFKAMTTIQERMRLSGENFWSTMAAILNQCKVNTDFDMKNLVDFDFFAALVKLRIISYGNNYKAESRCMTCGKDQVVDVDLDTLAVTELPDDFVEPFEIGPLPMSKDVLGCRFLRVYDYIDIHNKVVDWQRKHPKDTMNNPEYTLLMEKAIVTVNGVELNDIQKSAYVANMIGADSSYYHEKLSKMFYGLHRIGTSTCKETDCGSLVVYEIAPSESFFRATPISD